MFLLVVVFDAINLVININGKWDTIKTKITDYTAKAARVVRLAHSLKYLELRKIIANGYSIN